jgi:hypothetical protein
VNVVETGVMFIVSVTTYGLSSYLLYISLVGGFAAGGVGRGRRSNVVKEVERLKKNREERRQRQAELKEEKEVLMSMDPGNPNWEFLAMIRCVPDTPHPPVNFVSVSRFEVLTAVVLMFQPSGRCWHHLSVYTVSQYTRQ